MTSMAAEDDNMIEQEESTAKETYTEAAATEASSSLLLEIAQLKERLLRQAAEFDNYKKRQTREMDDFKKYAIEKVLRSFLPVIDNLDRALAATKGPQASLDNIVTGVKMVLEQFNSALQGHGVKGFESLHQPFDPNLHEALSERASDEHPPLTVLDEFQRGYLLHDRVLRPAMVVVAKAKADTADNA